LWMLVFLDGEARRLAGNDARFFIVDHFADLHTERERDGECR
jgi:hypothetical protein